MITIEDLTQRERMDIVGALLNPASETRKRRDHIRERYLVMRDEYEGLIHGWITDVYREPDVIAELKRHALPLFNPPKRAVDRLAVAYTHDPVRRIGKKSPKVTATKEWMEMLNRSRFNLYAREWNRAQIAFNTALILPLPRRNDSGNMHFDFQIVLGSIAEVIFTEGRSPFDPPDILMHVIPQKARAGQVVDPNAPVVRSIDSKWIVHFNARGDVVSSTLHGLGFFPGALVRNTVPDADLDAEEWWQGTVNLGAFRVMRATARIVASLDWTRKTQCRKLIAIASDADGPIGTEAEGEVISDPEATYKIRDANLTVHDLDQGVDSFLKHIHMYQDEALEIFTGAASNYIDPDPGAPIQTAQAARSHAAVMLHRRWSIGQLRPADLRLQHVMAAWMRELGEPGPDPELIRNEAVVEYPPLPFIDDPEKRLNWYVLAAKFGIVDEVMAAIEIHGWDETEALERLKAMQERRAELNEIKVTRNLPADGTQGADGDDLIGEDETQTQGRQGGRATPSSQAEAAR